jgi:hypothetical protein
MDFKKLMQKMQHLDEGFEPSFEECGGDMPAAIIQGGPPPEESLNMNLTINSKGADGIRDLLDVLKGIGSDSVHEPKDLPHDDDSEIVIGDSYGNEVEGDAGPKVFGLDALLHQGDKKDRETNKVNGGGNPQVQEALIQNLFSLYEEIKSRIPLAEMSPEDKQAAINAYLAKGGTIKKHDPQKEPSKRPYVEPKRKQHSSDEFKLRNDDGSIAKIPTVGFRKEPPIVNPNRKNRLTPDWEDKLAQLAAIKDKTHR